MRLIDYSKIGVDKAKNNPNLVCLLKWIKEKQKQMNMVIVPEKPQKSHTKIKLTKKYRKLQYVKLRTWWIVLIRDQKNTRQSLNVMSNSNFWIDAQKVIAYEKKVNLRELATSSKVLMYMLLEP